MQNGRTLLPELPRHSHLLRAMQTFFLMCALLGGGILVVQLLLGVLGIVHDGIDAPNAGGGDHDAHAGHDASEGLNLLSVRALSAGLGFFGVGGMAGLATGLGLLAALPLGIVLGLAAMIGTALVTRWMLRLEDDGSVLIDGAVGATGTVYLAIPGDRKGAGKVLLTLQNRTVEYQAVTSQAALPTGAPILVVDVVGPDTVDVVPDPITKELSNVV
jgi:hypothetical protein